VAWLAMPDSEDLEERWCERRGCCSRCRGSRRWKNSIRMDDDDSREANSPENLINLANKHKTFGYSPAEISSFAQSSSIFPLDRSSNVIAPNVSKSIEYHTNG
jgi:hypothetical protein